MPKGTCKIDECSHAVVSRGLCNTHYGRFRAQGVLEEYADPSARDHFHRIAGLNTENRTGTCSICGPVRVHLRSGGRSPQCYTLRAAEKRKGRTPRRKTTGSRRRRRAQSVYKITDAEMDALVARANGMCEICDTPTDFEHGARVDHCHDTGLVRGLLCHPCNIAIAWLRDDPQRALSAHFYLAAARTDRKTA